MRLYHVLKTAEHDIPLNVPDFLNGTSTLHELYRGEVTHKGFLLTLEVSEDAKTTEKGKEKKHKYSGHKFKLLIEPEEIDPWMEALTEMRDLDSRMEKILEAEDDLANEEEEVEDE